MESLRIVGKCNLIGVGSSISGSEGDGELCVYICVCVCMVYFMCVCVFAVNKYDARITLEPNIQFDVCFDRSTCCYSF